LKSEILSQEGNVVVVKAEYEAGEVDGAIGKTVRGLSKNANIKGFRKGHVPRSTLELFFGKSAIYKETLERLASDALEEVVTEYDLDLVTDPRIKLGELVEGGPLDVEFTFEVRPEVELPDVASLSAERIIYEVGDEDVDEGLRQILESGARLEPTVEDRPAVKDDIVEMQYTVSVVRDDGELKELDRDKKNTVALSMVRDDIAEAVVGHKPAEIFTFDLSLEPDYPDSRMAGKTVRYEAEVLQFMKRVVPEATDENVAEISRGRFGSVDEIRSELRSQLEANASARSDASLQESAIKALAAAASVDVPATMIDRQYMSMRREQDAMLRSDIKQSLDEYLQNNNLSVDEYEGGLKKRAEELVRNSIVLDALADRDSISFTNEDLNEEILRAANAMRMNPQEFADSLSGDRQEFAAFASRVRTKNVAKHLASLVQVTERREKFSAGDVRLGGADAPSGQEGPDGEPVSEV
jgi:trigger factor